MRPPKAMLLRGVNIIRAIRVLVMKPMIGCPPEGALLNRHSPKPSHGKLGYSAHFVAAMRKISMKARRYSKHAEIVTGNT
jgi:hypothetical protein